MVGKEGKGYTGLGWCFLLVCFPKTTILRVYRLCLYVMEEAWIVMWWYEGI